MTDKSTANVNIRMGLDLPELKKSQTGVDALGKSFGDLKGQVQDVGRVADQNVRSLSSAFSGIKPHIEADVKAVQQLRTELQGAAKDGQNVNAGGGPSASSSFRAIKGIGRVLGAFGDTDLGHSVQLLGTIGQVGARLNTVLEAMIAEETAAAGGFAAIEAALTPLVTAIAPVLLAVGALALIFEQITKAANDAVEASKAQFEADKQARNQDIENRKEARTKTQAQIKQQIEDDQAEQESLAKAIIDKRKEIDANNAKYAALGSSFNPAERNRLRALGEQLQEQINSLSDDFDKAMAKTSNDITKLAPAIDQTANTAKAFKTVLGGLDSVWSAVTGAFKRSLEDSAKAEADAKKKRDEDIAKTQAYSEKQNAELLAIGQKYADAEKALTQKSSDENIAIIRKAFETSNAITQKYLDEANASLQKLYDQEAQLQLNAGREEDKVNRQNALADVQVQINFRRQERDDLIAHQQKIREIERSFLSSERDAIYTRDFLALFNLQERKKDELSTEDQAAQDKKAAREQSLQDEQSDLARQRAFESNERKIALQNALLDAKNNYTKELALQAQAEAKERALLQQQTNNEITALVQRTNAQRDILIKSRDEQIALTLQTEQTKLQIQAAALAQIYAQAAAQGLLTDATQSQGTTTYDSNGQPITRFASGGRPNVGRPSLVNELGSSRNESFRTDRGKTIQFPGVGLFTPFTSGVVNPNTNGGGDKILNMTLNFQTGANAEQIRPIVERAVQDGFRRVMVN